MAEGIETPVSASPKDDGSTTPTCLAQAELGIKTGRDFAQFMSSLMSDLIKGTVTPGVGNAACNAGGKLLKVVEMQHRYGVKGGGKDGDDHELRLT